MRKVHFRDLTFPFMKGKRSGEKSLTHDFSNPPLRKFLLSFLVKTGRRKMISHWAWRQFPAFVTVSHQLTCLRCRWARPRALWLWPSAWRCCRSGAPLSSASPAPPAPPAPPASPTSQASGSAAACTRSALQLEPQSTCSRVLPVVSPSSRCPTFQSVLEECEDSQELLPGLSSGGDAPAVPAVSAAASFWRDGFETKP